MFENYFYINDPPEFNRIAWYGLIFRWYGIDKNGDIAIFETGELPIPKNIFTDKNAYRELDSFFRQLPKITSATVVTELLEIKKANGDSIDYSDYLSESGKGLFFIDEIDTYINKKRTFGFVEQEIWYGYYVKTVPNNKLNVKNLPEKIRNLLDPYYFPIEFSSIKKIDVTKFLDCE